MRYTKEEEILRQKLNRSAIMLLSVVVLVFIGLNFFGPQIGSLFQILSGNRGDQGRVDIIPPTPPIFSGSPNATNKKELSLNGIVEPGSTVKIFVNGPEKGKTTADSEGLFTFVDLPILEGKNIIFAKAYDQNNNESDKSVILEIFFDDEAPEITITSPQNGQTIKNLNKRIQIEGETNEKATVTINGRNAIEKSDNTFGLLLGVEEGDITIKVEAEDEAGNKSTSSITIRYEKS